MKMLIVGSRCIKKFDLSEYIPNNVSLIISGGASGIDTLAEEYADTHGISKLILRPSYEQYGKFAPLERNRRMVDIADKVLAIWDGKSRGTRFTIDYAKKLEKDIVVICVSEDL